MDFGVDMWVSVNRAICQVLGVVRVQMESSTTLTRSRWYVIVSNHQSWADILILQNELRHLCPVIKFFTKRELLWAPFFGLAMRILAFPYVRRFTSEQLKADPSLHRKNVEAMNQAARRFQERPIAILSFLEGTRFTTKKHSVRGSSYTNLLNPKRGGFAFALSQLNEVNPTVLDATIVYDGAVPSFWGFLCGRSKQVRLYLQELAAPNTEGNIQAWINDLWHQKDEFLSGNSVAKVRNSPD